MSDVFPVFAALTLACLAAARLAPFRWRGRFYGLALVMGLGAALLAVFNIFPGLTTYRPG